MNEATLFRDSDYGALSVSLRTNSIVTVDNGFRPADADRARRVLERYAKHHRVMDERTTSWFPDADCSHIAVMSAVESEMSMCGYVDDPLAENAIMRVDAETGANPDLPAQGKIIVHEAIERGIRQHIAVAIAALREHAEVTEPTLRYFNRPNAAMAGMVSAPFVVARLFADGASAGKLRSVTLDALQPLRAQLVKVSVTEADGQRAIEIGFAPTPKLCESFMDDAVPVFEHNNITGARVVAFALEEMLTEQERADIEELAKLCTGATSLRVEGNSVFAYIPSNFIGNYVADRALQERLSWLNGVLEPWGPDVYDIGDLSEVFAPPVSTKHAPLQELGEAAQQRWGVMFRHTRMGRQWLTPGFTQTGDPQRAMWFKFEDDAQDFIRKHNTGRVARMKGAVASRLPDAMESVSRQPGDAVSEMFHDLPSGPQALLRRFSGASADFFDTPQGKQAEAKALELVKKEDGAEIAKKFEEQLAIIKATAMESV